MVLGRDKVGGWEDKEVLVTVTAIRAALSAPELYPLRQLKPLACRSAIFLSVLVKWDSVSR